MSQNLSLGDRMKLYEETTRYVLPPRCFTFIRVDGKSFSNFTKKFKRPFDDNFVNMMNQSAIALCEGAQGCKIGFVQSDEITVVLTDFEEINTGRWFDGVIQKICSNSASNVTERFNRAFYTYLIEKYVEEIDPQFAMDYPIRMKDVLKLLKTEGAKFKFDSRVFYIPSPTDTINNLVWRQQDATRNSISSVARSLYSHSELNGKNGSQKQEMIFQKGQNWDKYPVGVKRGRVIKRGEDGKWGVVEPPIFSQDWEFLTNIIPTYK